MASCDVNGGQIQHVSFDGDISSSTVQQLGKTYEETCSLTCRSKLAGRCCFSRLVYVLFFFFLAAFARTVPPIHDIPHRGASRHNLRMQALYTVSLHFLLILLFVGTPFSDLKRLGPVAASRRGSSFVAVQPPAFSHPGRSVSRHPHTRNGRYVGHSECSISLVCSGTKTP